MKRNKTLQSDPMEQQQLSPSLMIYTRCMLQDTELTTKSARKADPSVASISVKGVALIYPAIFCGHLPSWASALTVLTPQSRFGGKLLEIGVVRPQSGTALLKGLMCRCYYWHSACSYISNSNSNSNSTAFVKRTTCTFVYVQHTRYLLA